MNNIFFFIKNILQRDSPDLIYFIVFDLYPHKDIFHFAISICESVFIDQRKKERLKKIYYKIFEFIILGIMLAFFGLYVIYLFIEMIILSFVDVFRSIYRK